MNHTTPTDGRVEDPTDAPDLTRGALSRLDRVDLLLAAAQVLGALIVAVLIVVAPDRIGDLIARVGGVAVVVVSLIALARVSAATEKSRTHLVGVVIVFVCGALLAIDPQKFLDPVVRVAGTIVVVFGLWRLVASRRVSSDESNAVRRLGAAAMVAGAVLLGLGDAAFEIVAVVTVLLTLASAVVRAGARTGIIDLNLDATSSRPLLLRWIEDKGKSPQRREDIYEQVFFEGDTAPSRIGRFLLMMLFASVISAAGVLADSTAVVIGAMLVAPLINPMMGMGLSLATGWPNRLGRSALVVLTGTVVAIGTGWIVAVATGFATDLDANGQIVSRSSPRVIDLVIAVAAGSAGAYALSRKDASSSLPGVAVAIALVPPLSVVGITAQGGDWEQAAGTLLLFLTNLVAIILAGGAVFLLTGVVPINRFAENQHRVRTALVSVGVLALVIVGALLVNGQRITQNALDQDDAQQVVVEWLGDESEFTVVSVAVDDEDVNVVLAGPGEPPSADVLAADLVERIGGPIRLDLQWIPRDRTIVTAGG